MITIFYTHFTKQDIDIHCKRLLNSVTQEIRETASRFYKKEDCFRSILGKLLVNHYFVKNNSFGQPIQSLKKDVFNRPYITGKVDFNISHSGNYVICAFLEGARIGVDIEKISSLDISDFDYIFHPLELEAIKLSETPLKLFFEIWVKKEAVTKAEGRGLGCPLKKINTLIDPVECSGKMWNTKLIQISKNYEVAIASISSLSTINLQEISILEL